METTQNDPKTIELNLKILVDMENNDVDVKTAQVNETPELSYRQKIGKILSEEILLKKQKLDSYTTTLAETELSETFRMLRAMARAEYELLVNLKLMSEMI